MGSRKFCKNKKLSSIFRDSSPHEADDHTKVKKDAPPPPFLSVYSFRILQNVFFFFLCVFGTGERKAILMKVTGRILKIAL